MKITNLITIVEIRHIAETNGWKVYVDSDGWYCFTHSSAGFAPRMVYFHNSDANILKRFLNLRDELRSRYCFLTQREDMGALEDLIGKVFNYISEREDVCLW